MTRWALCAGLLLVSINVARAGIPQDVWLISTSDTEFTTSTSPWVGDRTLYLWTYQSPLWDSDHAEFGLTSSNLQIISFTPRGLWTNHGSTQDLILDRSACLHDGEVVGELVVRDATGLGGNVCFRNSSTGYLCSRLCQHPGPWLGILWQGLSSDGTFPVCHGVGVTGCDLTVSVDPDSWGRVKATYR